MSCDEVLRLLREREAACRGEAERLRAEAERITALLATCERELARITTACEVVGELPRIEPVPAAPAAVAFAVVPAARRPPDARAREQLLAVLARYAGPVRCRQVVEDLGLEVTARQVEVIRHRLKKAVAAGVVVQTPGGLFTLARGTVAAGG
ncbi:hypothetical protein [Streptomyces gibsoniae]|uniref:Uncharacterized protein n=1 Tax=Streptomyces gibsoniae TaxID=3075529 RepID=A0ABU2UA07_9ACTN|nr:hypothetical protein [Streptomyces sp. DSM 41699]MDT0470008.1 hypothetical protein [Streptomyces sp. DSM 41699]